MQVTATQGAPFPTHPRYEITAAIGSGDFAAVYRARDRELGREVAIKQIHQQYLNDPRRLERFWREAQLLASLEHPHIMTIYDIVRPHGWLVLELMQGTLLDATRGQPIDLSLLRGSLAAALSGLTLLHSRGTLHGDIKPSNLLIDRLGRIKLGDFGLARRVASDQGSYLKGATRYMAPEMAAPQFGPVGPASDLYSLGFTAYELLCGTQQFEQLFPGLDAFGRDKQVAWMMWHAAPDRRLPPIDSVLGGVPEDLARVIQRLTIKDQSQRYQSAAQALADLSPAGEVTANLGDDGAEAAAKKAAFHRRAVSFGALAASVLLCTLILFFPNTKKPVPVAKPDIVVRGVVRSILPDRQTLIVEDAATATPREFQLDADAPISLNDQPTLLRDLVELDQVSVIIKHDEQGKQRIEVQAARPRGDEGIVAQVKPDVGALRVTLTASGEELNVQVPASCPIELNEEKTIGGRPLRLADLKAGDRVILRHFHADTGETALEITALRIVPGEGVIVGIDAKKNELTIASGSAESGSTTVLPMAERCEVVLNGRRTIDGQLLTIADLKPGDAVTYQRDVELVSIAVQRQFEASGAISAIRYDVRSFIARLADGTERTFLLQPDCRTFLGSEPVKFEDLRRGDQVEVAFSSPDAESPEAANIVAERPPDASKWAILVVSSTFDDSAVPPLPAAAAAADKLRGALTARYAVPAEQILSLENPSRVRLEQGFAGAVAKAGSASQLIIVFAGRVALVQGAPLLAPQDFASARAADTGVPLAPLLTLVDGSPVKVKIVLLDLDEAAAGAATAAADWFPKIQGTRSKPLLKTTNVIASAASGPAGSGEALLVAALSAALSGEADPNRDNLCELTELYDYLQRAGGSAPPRLFLPNDTPPRITDDAKEAIRRLAVLAGEVKVNTELAQSLALSARALAPQEIEPRLVAALVQLKARQHTEALAILREVLIQKPATPVAWEASAWAKFERRTYQEGMSDLVQLLKHLPADSSAAGAEGKARVLPWIGRLREFCAQALPADRRPSAAALAALDAAIAARSNEEKKLMAEGRDAVREVLADFDRRLADATETNAQVQLRYERWQLRHHASLSCEALVQQVLARLDD